MPASPIDSALYRDLFHDAEVGTLFTDSAEIRAMMLVEGALAKAQAAHGLIPDTAAAAIDRAAREVQIDPAALSKATGQNAVVVPAFVAAFRAAMNAPEHAQYLHWGATSQDIMDTALVLRLARLLAIQQDRLTTLARALGTLAGAHAELPMAGRTYGQVATPTTFGAVAASWGAPLLRHLDRLAELKPRLLQVSLSGAAGTLSMMGDHGPGIRAALAQALNLGDPQASWHSTRDGVAEFSGWLTLVTGTLGKIGEDLLVMTQTGIQEITLGTGGSSSTMPQKTNPVLPSLLVALARQTNALNAAIQGAALHRQQRDGAAWMVEWLSLPQICIASARALAAATEIAKGLDPVPGRMRAGIDDGPGLIYAEALSFALAGIMPRPEAQQAVKALCQEAAATGTPLAALAAARWPEAAPPGLFTPEAQLGLAPAEARAFAKAARAL